MVLVLAGVARVPGGDERLGRASQRAEQTLLVGFFERFVLAFDELMGGEEAERGHLEQERMEEELFGRGPLGWVGLHAFEDEVLLLGVLERFDRLLDQLGRYWMRVAVAAKLQVEHLG